MGAHVKSIINNNDKETLHDMLIVQWYFPIIAASLNIMYGVLLYMCGPTPELRRRGLNYLYDCLISFIIFSIFLVMFLNLQKIINIIALSLGLKQVHDKDVISVLRRASKYFLNSFNNVKNLLVTLYIICATLNAIPYTVPMAMYLSQTTQYMQWMAHWALINLYMYHILAEIASYSIAIAGIGMGLIVPRHTRTIGSLLTSLAIVLPAQVELVYIWELTNQLHLLLPHNITITNAIKIAKDIALGGYNIGEALQRQNIIIDLASATGGAIIYALSKIIDETGHYIKL